MTVLEKWRRPHGRQGSEKAAGRAVEAWRQGNTPLRSLRSGFDRAFDRVWRELDRGPWSLLRRDPEQGLFEGLTENWPAIDMAEDDKGVTLRVDVPGMEPKDIDVEVSGHTLTLRGTRQDEWEDKNRGIYRRERVSGSFVRSVTLPDYVDAQKIEARYDKGTLTLTAPKMPGKAPKRIQIS